MDDDSRAMLRSFLKTLVLACLLLSVVPTVAQQNPAPHGGKYITVWKVGSPHRGDTPDTAVAPFLKKAAEKMGFTMKVKAFPAEGFAKRFFEAFKVGRQPDVLAFNNYGILDGITTRLGNFTGIASDDEIRKQLVEVTESLSGIEGLDSFGSKRGWEFLIRSSRQFAGAKRLALRSPECNPRWGTAALTKDLESRVIPMARAYLQGDYRGLAGMEDPKRLHTDIENPSQRNVLEIRGCGYWGDGHLAFVPAVSTYESPQKLGRISLLLVLRKSKKQWRLLVAATDPISVSRFPQGIPKLVSLIRDTGTRGRKPHPARLVAPADGQLPAVAQGQRFGNFVWRPSRSHEVVAQVIEFAYNDDARLFLRFSSGPSQANDEISEGQLWTTRGLWRWRVWSISDSGRISFSKARSFTH